MMKTKVLVGLLLFLIVLNLATIGTYLYITLTKPPDPPFPLGPPGMHGEGFRGGRMPPMPLDEDQRAQLMEIMMDFRTETQGLRDSVMQLEREALELLKGEEPSLGAVDRKLAGIADVRLMMSRAATRKVIEAKSYLTPEQQEFFITMMVRFQSRVPRGMMPFRMKPPMGPRPEKGGRRNR
jgi:Spy/CpxP family protein refolding chaperone